MRSVTRLSISDSLEVVGFLLLVLLGVLASFFYLSCRLFFSFFFLSPDGDFPRDFSRDFPPDFSPVSFSMTLAEFLLSASISTWESLTRIAGRSFPDF